MTDFEFAEGRIWFVPDGINSYAVETDILDGTRRHIGTVRREHTGWQRYVFRAYVGSRLMGEAVRRKDAAAFLL